MADDEQTSEELAPLVELLERLAADRELLAQLPDLERKRLLQATSQLAFPDRAARRQQQRKNRQRKQADLESKRKADKRLLAETGMRAPTSIRQLKKASPPAPFDPPTAPTGEHPAEHFGPQLQVPRACYMCKREYDRVHFFYDSMCADCAELNWTKREQTADLSGRVALVTGGRVKIGYQARC